MALQSLGIHVAALLLFALWPLATDSSKFWQLRSTIEIRIQKNSPPYQAFKQIKGLSPSGKSVTLTTAKLEKAEQFLSVDDLPQANIQAHRKVVLLEPVVVKRIPNLDLPTLNVSSADDSQVSSSEPVDLNWISTLPLRQRIRMEEAQAKYAIFDNENKPVPQPQPTVNKKEDAVKVTIVKSTSGYTIRGPWEITGGLGFTNDHYVDLRRTLEGTPKEAGQVSIKDGIYTIQVDGLYGTLVAKMYDKGGAVIGEGGISLDPKLFIEGKAPKLIIKPQRDHFAGTAVSAYGLAHNQKANEQTQTSKILGNEADLSKGTESTLQYTGVQKGSQTIGRFTGADFVDSNTVLIAGQEFTATRYPKNMIKAFKEIVSEQLNYDLNDPNLPVIWGQVLLDGKPVPGVQVEVESAPEAKIIYFDSINLPDTNLKETSANGFYAVIGLSEGFHALIAKRTGQYFAHNIAITETASVSSVNLESSLKTKNVPMKVFDVFSGQPLAAEIEMQSVENPVHINEQGWATTLLPVIPRLSLMQVIPKSEEYLPAQYFYQDSDEYIHVPLISEDWLMNILQPKWNIIDSNKGTVVGIVVSEDYEVYLAGNSEFDPQNITYFNAEGVRIDRGLKGGGFIINNLDPQVHEVVVIGKESQKVHSQVLPVDERSVSVIKFQEN